jgi:purine-binding chemotaxis protein CheW
MEEIDRSGVNQYLTFKLAEEVYAINVANIKEVLAVPKVRRVPRMPDFLSGVINLRGSVVPVLDIRLKFGFGSTPISIDTGIIVTEVFEIEKGDDDVGFTIGIFSDIVQKVVTIEPTMIEPPPKIGFAIDTDFIVGMGHIDDEFVVILNINKLLSEDELMLSPVDGAALYE